MRIFQQKLSKKLWLVMVPFFTGALFLLPRFAHAESLAAKAFNLLIGAFMFAFVQTFGRLLLVMIDLLLKIGSYNDFVDAQSVVIGWSVVRDVMNIAFIIGLLAIAFGTVLRIQSYHYKNTLLKLLIMALLVNFSKTITGVFIDLSQVVMLTFFNAIKTAASGNFTIGFGIDGLLNMREAGAEAEIDWWSLFSAFVMGCIMVLVAMVLMLVMVVMLLWRILMLWVLIILSPIAYVAQAIPALKQYGDRWWQTLTKYLVNGPVLAFFLWLVLSMVSFNYTNNLQTQSQTSIVGINAASSSSAVAADAPGTSLAVGASKITEPLNVLDYITMVALLMMAITMAASAGVYGAGFAGNALNTVRSIASLPLRAATGAALLPFKGIRKGVGYAGELLAGAGYNVLPSQWGEAWKENRARVRARRLQEGRDKARQRIAGKGGVAAWIASPHDFTENYLNAKTLFSRAGRARFGRMLTGKDAEERDRIAKELKDKGDAIEANKKAKETTLKTHGEDKERLQGTVKEQNALANQFDQKLTSYKDSDADDMRELVAKGSIELKGHPEFRMHVVAAMARQNQLMNDKSLSDTERNRAKQRFGHLSMLNEDIKRNPSGRIALTDRQKNLLDDDDLGKNYRRYLEAAKMNAQTKRNEADTKIREGEKVLTTNLSAFGKKEEELKADVDRLQIEMVRVKPPEMFYARGANRQLVNEEAKKIAHIHDSGELIAMLKQAEEEQDQTRVTALLTKLTSEANFNDVLNSHGYSTGSIEDVHAFFQEKIIGGKRARRKTNKDGKTVYDRDKDGQLLYDAAPSERGAGMQEQAALSLEQDLTYLAEDIGHWYMARGIGYKNGRLVQLSLEDQSDSAVNEMGKGDAENLVRRLNRLAVGGERPDGTFDLGMVGAKWIMQNWKSFNMSVFSRKNANRSLMSNITSPQAKAQLKKLSDSLLSEKERTDKEGFYDLLDTMEDLSREKQKKTLVTNNAEISGFFDELRHAA